MGSNRVIAEDEISIFCEQIAMVLKSGVPLYEGLEAVCENYRGTKYEEYFLSINEDYQKGDYLNPAVIIDTNHGNSGKDPFEQPRIIKEVL